MRDLKKSPCRRIFGGNAEDNANAQDDFSGSKADDFGRLRNRDGRKSIRQSASRSAFQTAFSYDDPKARDGTDSDEAIT